MKSRPLPKDKSLGVTDSQSELLDLVNDEVSRTFGAKSSEELINNMEYMNETDLRELCFRVGVSTMGSKVTLKERIINSYNSKVRQSIGELHRTNPEPIKLSGKKKDVEAAKKFLASF